MTPERWQHVKQVLANILELAPAERAACLDRSCAADASLRDDIEPLLASEQRLGDRFLDHADLAAAVATVVLPEENFWIGRRVGPYKVVEQIGMGGMGEVYRAFRADDQYEKVVALKFVRTGQYSSEVLARFKNERQILAGLDHPNLAKLLDGGTSDEGMPYFVMELIDGQPITEYCNEHGFSIRERLKLFSQVCAAVHYAHQRLIIHRDIKPGNILVTADGIPKLLDFGIAKILESGQNAGTAETTLTSFRGLTPRYASPEQIKGEAMTIATDVYSLGVVLYELLTGRSPYEFLDVSTQDFAQQVCEGEPQRPSLVVLHSKKARDGNVENQSAAGELSPQKLSKQLRGDIDNIVLMALRKEPSRRYASVNDLQEDIQRHLENIPVRARNDSVRYRTTKFVVRHRAAVAASALVVLAMLTGLIVTLHEARVARTERARAERRFNDVRKLANSLMFEVHDSIQDLPGSTPARKLLVSRAIEYLDNLARESAGDASLQAELADAYERVGKVQGGDFGRANLGDNQGALASFRRMLAIRQSLASANPNDIAAQVAVARSYRAIGDLQAVYLGDLKSALENCTKALAITEPLSKSNPGNDRLLRELAADYEKLGDIQGGGNGSAANLGDIQAALANHIRSQALVESLAGQTPADRYLQRWLAVADFKLQNDLNESDDLEAAMLRAREAVTILQRLADQRNNTLAQHDVAAGYDALANLSKRNGRFADSLLYFRKEVELFEPSVLADPKNVEYAADLASARANVGYTLCKTRHCRDGIPLLRSALAAISGLDPSGDNAQIQASVAGVENALADALGQSGQRDEELHHYAHAREIYRRITSLEPMDLSNRMMLAAVENAMADAYRHQGHFDRAITGYTDSLAIGAPLLSARTENLRASYSALRSYAGLGDTAVTLARQTGSSPQREEYWNQARAWYRQSLDVAKRIPRKKPVDPSGFDSPDIRIVILHLAQCDQALAAAKTLVRNSPRD